MIRGRRFRAKNVPASPFMCPFPRFAAGKVGRGIVGGVEGSAPGTKKGLKESDEEKEVGEAAA
jgi:hypothetical protein